MRREHFERLAPLCLQCQLGARRESPLRIGAVARSTGDDVLEGTLVCSLHSCQREWPIIDGIPIIVPDVRGFVSANLESIIAREDLSDLIEGFLRDCLGTSGWLPAQWMYLSGYAQDHYEHDDSVRHVLATGISMLSAPPTGPWLEVGCSAAGGCFELARRTGDLVVGVDTNIRALRLARQLITHGTARYSRKRIGVVYDTQTIEVEASLREYVEVWACDAKALPFAGRSFSGGVSLNVVDSVDAPVRHLSELGRVLVDGAEAIIATPYDWQETVTELPQWIGGHSPRADSAGDPAREMRRILSEASPPELGVRLRLIAERDRVPWRVTLNERAAVTYQTHLVVARATAS